MKRSVSSIEAELAELRDLKLALTPFGSLLPRSILTRVEELLDAVDDAVNADERAIERARAS